MVGDEFGPFLLHTDATGKVLESPFPLPRVKSPDYPADFTPPFPGDANLGRSNGFEGMAISPDGRTLYPVLEGPVSGDDARARRVREFDVDARAYTGRGWTYEVADPTLLVSDFTALDPDPNLISLPGQPGDVGLGDPFSMPYVTIESVLPLRGDRLAIVNDTNFGSTGRKPRPAG